MELTTANTNTTTTAAAADETIKTNLEHVLAITQSGLKKEAAQFASTNKLRGRILEGVDQLVVLLRSVDPKSDRVSSAVPNSH